MKELLLNVREVLGSPSALSREQGEQIYNKIFPVLIEGGNVTLDFGEIESVITPFLNVAIGKLYSDLSSEQLNNQLHIINPPDSLYSKVNIVAENAKRFYGNQEYFTRTVKENLGII